MIDSSIAVIVPVYNVERYLDETLISIKNQISKQLINGVPLHDNKNNSL